MDKPALTTHVLNLASGKPASGIAVELHKMAGAADAVLVASGTTDSDGRVASWNTDFALPAGDYLIEFATGPWFEARGEQTLYPRVSIVFSVQDHSHYHIPLLLSPYGYSTYRGS